MGDTAVIDYEGFCDGVAFAGGKAENHGLILGSHSFIDTFEEQLIGKNIGEEVEVNVEFPAEYHAEELAGKEAVFKVKLNALKFNELPALDDEFVRDVSEFDTLDEYKADIKAKIVERNTKAADADVEEQLIAALIEKLEADIPEAMFEAETENLLRDYDNRLRMQGLDLNTYFKYTGMTLDTMREQFRPQAERQVKARLALEKIVANECIVVADEDIEKEYQLIADTYKMELEQVKMYIPASELTMDVAVGKAVEFVKNNAEITEEKVSARNVFENTFMIGAIQ